MGVMECNRKGCEEIMCSTYTSEGYICYECKSEFASKQDSAGFDIIDAAFKLFMETPKNSLRDQVTGDISPEDYFNLHD